MDIDYDKYPQARIFETHGVEFAGHRDDEFYGHCPFSDKPNKFYVNRETWLWDSKTAGMSGNLPQFLEAVSEDYKEGIDVDEYKALSKDRRLPISAFKAWEVGWTGNRYTVPIRNIDGKIVDIRLYGLKRHTMKSTAGCQVGLMGSNHLKDRLDEPVYLCEGEWDAMALSWLLRKLGKPGIVCAVPGAGIFKREWTRWFYGRRVFMLYDHDDPGIRGEQRALEMLDGKAKSIEFIHWPDELHTGWDVRDWIIYGIKKRTLDLCLERLHKLFSRRPRIRGGRTVHETGNGRRFVLIGNQEERKPRERPAVVPGLVDVHKVYRKWLHLPNTNAIDVMLATALSQEMDGPPVWMFLVSPPGGAKTITLAGLHSYEKTYQTSSLTSHSLISGHDQQKRPDPSLIPRLNGKVLVIKDFTSILGMRDSEKEEIFGILRDAYDGKCGKVFGNGLERTYESRFTIIAAVTPSIYEIGARHSALGERFLKYTMGDNLHHHQEEEIISKAIENVDNDTQIREELADVTADFLQFGLEHVRDAKLDNSMHHRIIALAQFGARLRGTVSRDTYNTEMMTGRPFAEVGSRLGIQLAKLARAMAMIRQRKHVTEEEFLIVRKVMLDTVSQRSEDIVRTMWNEGKGEWLTIDEIATRTRYSVTTVRRIIDDLNLLKVVHRKGAAGSGFKHSWTLTRYIRRAIESSRVYAVDEMPNASGRIVLRPGRFRGGSAGRGGAPAGAGRKPAQNPGSAGR